MSEPNDSERCAACGSSYSAGEHSLGQCKFVRRGPPRFDVSDAPLDRSEMLQSLLAEHTALLRCNLDLTRVNRALAETASRAAERALALEKAARDVLDLLDEHTDYPALRAAVASHASGRS